MNAISLTTLLIIGGYATSASLQSFKLFGKLSCPSVLFRIMTLMLLIGHGFLLYRWVETGPGQNLDEILMLSLTFWLMGLIVFLASHDALLKLTPIIDLMSGISVALYFVFHGYEPVMTHSFGKLFHIFVSLLASSVLFLALTQALSIRLQNHLLRIQASHPILKILPPLQPMESLLFYIIGTGFVLLSLSLVSGYLTIEDWFLPQSFPKVLLGSLAWIMFFGILAARIKTGLRGALAANLTLLASALLFSSYFGTKLILNT